MQSKTITIIVFILSVLFISMSCVLDNIVPRSDTTELEAWGRFFVGIFGSSAFICFGLTLITVPHNWLEKYIPLYRRDKQPSKLVVGSVSIFMGVMGMLLDVWIMMQF